MQNLPIGTKQANRDAKLRLRNASAKVTIRSKSNNTTDYTIFRYQKIIIRHLQNKQYYGKQEQILLRGMSTRDVIGYSFLNRRDLPNRRMRKFLEDKGFNKYEIHRSMLDYIKLKRT